MTTHPHGATVLVPRNSKDFLLLPSIRVEVLEGPDQGKSMKVEKGILVIGNPKRTEPDTNAGIKSNEAEADFVLTDPKVSDRHLVVRRDFSSETERYVLRDLNSGNGTFVNSVQVREAYLSPNLRVSIGDTVLRFVTNETEPIKIQPATEDELEGIIGISVEMKQLFEKIKRLAISPVSILIQGETGTGKELIARAIHNLSSRKDKPFVTFDCAMHVNSDLVHSALFGHVKGAFTGATHDRPGAFEDADQGTIFIDELGELPYNKQPMLLRALQSQTTQRLGSNQFRNVNTRVIAATHHDLLQDIEAGEFRDDLYYRLAVVTLHVPNLRSRAMNDVEPLFQQFYWEAQEDYNRQLSPGQEPCSITGIDPKVIRALETHPWPGNVRELRNIAIGAVSQRYRGIIQLEDLPPQLQANAPTKALASLVTSQSYAEAKEFAIRRFEKEFFQQHLNDHNFNVSEVSRNVNVTRKVIHRVIKEHDLKK